MTNNSGVQRTVINTRERAVSTDINLLQSRGNRDYMTLFRRTVNDIYADDSTHGLGEGNPTNEDDPDTGFDVYGGFELSIFSTHLLIAPGTGGANAQPGSFETSKDSEYVMVNDPGVTDAGTLPFVANSNGVDIVECQVGDVVFTTESRDIYDPLTGLFTASLVTKAAGSQLTYRIRQGTSFPGTASGWFPLYVGIHAPGSASFNNVDFYDVRPLVNERTGGLSRVRFAPKLGLAPEMMWAIRDAGGGDFELFGRYFDPSGVGGGNEASRDSNGFVLRGEIVQTIPGKANDVDASEVGINLNDADYFAVGVPAAPSIERWLYVVAVQPEALPRWVRYRDANAGVRKLSKNRGLIVIVDNVAATVLADGTVSGIDMPAAYDLGSTNQTGRVIATVFQKSDNTFVELHCGQNGWIYTAENQITIGPTAVESNPNAATLRFEWDMDGPGDVGGFLPKGAISALSNLEAGYTSVATSRVNTEITVSESTAGATALMGRRRQNYGQLPSGTDQTFRQLSVFNWPSESMPHAGDPAGGINNVFFNLEIEFEDTTVVHDATSDSALLLGVQVEWA